MLTVYEALDAFCEEHCRCDELDGGAEVKRVSGRTVPFMRGVTLLPGLSHGLPQEGSLEQSSDRRKDASK